MVYRRDKHTVAAVVPQDSGTDSEGWFHSFSDFYGPSLSIPVADHIVSAVSDFSAAQDKEIDVEGIKSMFAISASPGVSRKNGAVGEVAILFDQNGSPSQMVIHGKHPCGRKFARVVKLGSRGGGCKSKWRGQMDTEEDGADYNVDCAYSSNTIGAMSSDSMDESPVMKKLKKHVPKKMPAMKQRQPQQQQQSAPLPQPPSTVAGSGLQDPLGATLSKLQQSSDARSPLITTHVLDSNYPPFILGGRPRGRLNQSQALYMDQNTTAFETEPHPATYFLQNERVQKQIVPFFQKPSSDNVTPTVWLPINGRFAGA